MPIGITCGTRSADDYLSVYGRVLQALDRPAILHWLGLMFDPQLAGHWGSTNLDLATETVLELVTANAATVDGVKMGVIERFPGTVLP